MVYHQFATVYDELMAHAPYAQWIEFTEEMLVKYNKSPTSIVDLGCGTGEITIRLADLGYEIKGVDYSIEMLSVAETKANEKGVSIQWIEQDIRYLSGFEHVDCCISYCDVLNYILTKQDLRQVFQHVYACLDRGGLFIFDVHDSEYAKNELMNQTFTDITDDLACIWECDQGESIGQMHHYLTFFIKENDHYIRFEEHHCQQTYPLHIYEALLKAVGFSKVHFYHDFNSQKEILTKNLQRNFIVAVK